MEHLEDSMADLGQVRARINFVIEDALEDAIEDVEWCVRQLAHDERTLATAKQMAEASRKRLEEARAWLIEVREWWT